MLIHKKRIKEYALDTAKERFGRPKFTRVSPDFYAEMEGILKDIIKTHIKGLPSKGKTIK